MKGNHAKKEPGDLTPKGVAREATNILTQHLKKLGREVHSVADDGTPITRFMALAQLVWNKSLGYEEKIVLDSGEEVVTVHKPDKSYINLIFDRTEGRVAPTTKGDDKKKLSLSDRIGEQAKVRLNALAKDD